MARQFVYFMQGLTKSYPTRKVLDNVHLSFYPDAKIGVLGVNGSGKSTLLRIMAGLDKEYNGEAWVAEGARVGYLEQEPQLDPAKSVRENVMLGVGKQKAILDRYNELAMNYSEETADEMTKLQDEIEAADLWDLDSKVDQAMDRGLAKSPSGQVQGALPALRRASEAGQRKADTDRADHDSGRRTPGPERGRLRRPEQSLRRPRADRRSHLQAAARRHRRRDRRQRRRQDHAVPHDYQAGDAGQGRHHGW